jgi:hypothetical protein
MMEASAIVYGVRWAITTDKDGYCERQSNSKFAFEPQFSSSVDTLVIAAHIRFLVPSKAESRVGFRALTIGIKNTCRSNYTFDAVPWIVGHVTFNAEIVGLGLPNQGVAARW